MIHTSASTSHRTRVDFRHLVLNAHQRLLSAFYQCDDTASDIAELLKDVFPLDPATTFAFYSKLEEQTQPQRLQTHCIEKRSYDSILYGVIVRDRALLERWNLRFVAKPRLPIPFLSPPQEKT
jgi:hypothetical protein